MVHMLDMFAVIIDRPNALPARIGPFIAHANAQRYADRLDTILRKRVMPQGTTVYVDIANPSYEHFDARLPTDPWSLRSLVDAGGEENAFPDLYTRLCAQLGQSAADLVWDKATGWSPSPADANGHVDELTAAAEEWRGLRAEGTGALEQIAVELWRCGLHNVRRIGGITGLSRTTIYAALRAKGIDPTDRATEED